MSTPADLNNLYTALNLEIAAVARYEDHQSRTADPAIYSLLQGLMRNEAGHEEELEKTIIRLKGDVEMAYKLPGPTQPGMVFEGTQKAGQRTNLAMLRADLDFELDATKIYHRMAAEASDEDAKKLFIELSRAERGHVNGLTNVIKSIEETRHEVTFFCPVCGWSVPFGATPEIGIETRCPMCGVTFTLGEGSGDYLLERNK